jgi:hypothetical protein
MTPTTIDLFTIHHHDHLLDQLHTCQRERLAERAAGGDERPAGMRLSIPDPVRRVKAAFDPFWQLQLDEGVGMRGHVLEDYLEVALFHGLHEPLTGTAYDAQVAIQWHEQGRSAFDFVAQLDDARRVISCKSSIRSDKPSSANVAQEKRMLALAGYPADSTFQIWVINPSTLRATGPHPYTLTSDDITAAHAELAAVSEAYAYFADLADPTRSPVWNDADAWRERFGLESTSGAFRYASLEASDAIDKRNLAYLRARENARLAKAEEEAARELIRTHVTEQLDAAKRDGIDAKSVIAYGVDDMAIYTVDKRGAMRCTIKPIEAASVA